MKYDIFYSWQSDLPNSDNRNFIEDCIRKAIKMSNTDIEMGLYIDYDRDTKGKSGSPDISETIFDKIEKTDMFICDISIINPDYQSRKSPNPNVLLELGYASRVLGWEKVICLYNLKYGDIKDIPFDLSHRRILTYNSDEPDSSNIVSKVLSEAIKLIYSKGLFFNPLKDYMKGKIDYCLLNILKQLCCIVYCTNTMTSAFYKTKDLLKLEENTIKGILEERNSILGFFAHNDLQEAKKMLEDVFSKITTSNLYPIEWSITVLKIIEWLKTYQLYISNRLKYKLYISTLSPSPFYKVISGHSMNSENPINSYILLKKLSQEGQEGQVMYSGTMPKTEEKILLSPHRINVDAIDSFTSCLIDIIHIANKWLTETGDEIILDSEYYVLK